MADQGRPVNARMHYVVLTETSSRCLKPISIYENWFISFCVNDRASLYAYFIQIWCLPCYRLYYS